MIVANLSQVRFTYTTEALFTDLSWEIHGDRCVGLIGPNGSGKSTLLQLIAGDLTPDEGLVSRRKGLSVGYLHQEPKLEPSKTVLEEAHSASKELRDIEHNLSQVQEQLSDPAVYQNDKRLARKLGDQSKLLERFEDLGGLGYENRVRSTLHSLGFSKSSIHLEVEKLSGGQKKLLGLAKLLITAPDLLLLDEPDNHLDLRGKAFLEKFIRNYPGAVILVSHDRYMLDLVVDEIVELEDGRLTVFPGIYSEFAVEKQIRLQRQQQHYLTQQKTIERLEQSAKRLMNWGRVYDNESFSRRGKNILKRIERMDKVDRPVIDRRKMGLELPGWRGSNKVLEIQDLMKEFQRPLYNNDQQGIESILLREINCLIWWGDRVGLIGPNGAGKSLLFRMILGEEYPTKGEIIVGPSVKIGYYAQEHETLSDQLTLIDTIRQSSQISEEGAIAFLSKFQFTYEQAQNPVANLSGGERSRLQLALVMKSDANLLLLDEPTNNLDIPSAEVLENALAGFEGSILVISHDRYFLDRIVDRILELEEGLISEFKGGYSDYETAKKAPQGQPT